MKRKEKFISRLDFSEYLSVFSWRYGSKDMRVIFGEKHKYELWRKIWVALAKAQFKAKLVSKRELDDLVRNQNKINISRIFEIEKETKHDVVAAIREYAEEAKIGGGKIHLGATSMDITDNTDILKIKEALIIIEERLKKVLKEFKEKIECYADVPCLGLTHLQPAEPTTVGYRLAFYAQDLLNDLKFLKFVQKNLRGKGMKGAVGTGASYQRGIEKAVMESLGLKAFLISSQVYPRKIDYWLLAMLAGIGSSLAKFSADLRILQSPMLGEWSEPLTEKQVGSSAMPFKRNPINAEKICSLARYLLFLTPVALENNSLSYLERTLDDSANRRIIIPEAFLTAEEILITAEKLINGLVINEDKIRDNLRQYAPFAAMEMTLIDAVKQGADRQKAHEAIRKRAMKAWEAVQRGEKNPLPDEFLKVKKHLGQAPTRARKCAKMIEICLRQ
ncbi:MAG TPA: adenylosuccinate lyase [Candidatus Woesebacteria bacterium]|nr:adenylosuccinate lyase [Candidatus Woesebacteria bacterium]